MNRRGFLAGLLASAAMPAAARSLRAESAAAIAFDGSQWIPFGRSPCMHALPNLRTLNEMVSHALNASVDRSWFQFGAVQPPILDGETRQMLRSPCDDDGGVAFAA